MQIHHYGAGRFRPTQGLRLANNESSSFQMSRCFEICFGPEQPFRGHCRCKRKGVLVGEAAYLELSFSSLGKWVRGGARLISGTMALAPSYQPRHYKARRFRTSLTGQAKSPADG